MRTTLEIEDDLQAAAKEMASRQRLSAGQLISRLLREAMSGTQRVGQAVGGRCVLWRAGPYAPSHKTAWCASRPKLATPCQASGASGAAPGTPEFDTK